VRVASRRDRPETQGQDHLVGSRARDRQVLAAAALALAVPTIAWGVAGLFGAAADDVSFATITAAALLGTVGLFPAATRLLAIGLLAGAASAVLIFLFFFFE
jgi:hypothetical protein